MSLPVHRITATDCNAAAHANFKVKYSGILETKTAREKRGGRNGILVKLVATLNL